MRKSLKKGETRLEIYSCSDVGLVRETNQDAFQTGYLEENDVVWAVVCDGMGGANGGNVASTLAVETITQQICEGWHSDMNPNSIKNLLTTATANANLAVYLKSKEDASLRGMGTTVIVALIAHGVLYLVHAGDSRAYLMDDETIAQITTDHTVVQSMVDNGEITEEQALHHPQKHIITRALGVQDRLLVDYNEFEFQGAIRLLICTDGLSNYLDAQTIFQLSKEYEADCLVENMVALAKEMGGRDNITAVLIKQ